MDDYCICGHLLNVHLQQETNRPVCKECWYDYLYKNHKADERWIHIFKLDNLKLIEDLAKERNLL